MIQFYTKAIVVVKCKVERHENGIASVDRDTEVCTVRRWSMNLDYCIAHGGAGS